MDVTSPPWLAWLAICLCYYVQRLSWMADLEIPLDGQLEPTLSDEPWGRPLPGLPRWRFALWHDGVTIRSDEREVLTLPLVEKQLVRDEPTQIHPGRFAEWASRGNCSLKAPLQQWVGGREAIEAALHYLEEKIDWLRQGFLSGPLLRFWESRRFSTLADWEELGQSVHGGDGDAHRDFLMALIQPRRNDEAIRALLQSVLHPKVGNELLDFCRPLLDHPLDHCTAATIRLLDDRTENQAVSEVLAVEFDARPDVALAILRYLRHRQMDTGWTLPGLLRLSPCELDYVELAVLTYQSFPDTGLVMLQRCLRTYHEPVRLLTVNVLSKLNEGWAERELDQATAELSAVRRGQPAAAMPAIIDGFVTRSLRLGAMFKPPQAWDEMD